jgi:hypothetical protein
MVRAREEEAPENISRLHEKQKNISCHAQESEARYTAPRV